VASIQTKAFLKLIKLANLNPERNSDVIKSTKKLEKLGAWVRPAGFVLEKHKIEHNVHLEIFKRKGIAPRNLIYIIHGGGFLAGLSNWYREAYMKYFKAGYGAAVVNIDYRTAPAHKYPAAHEDAMNGWNFLMKQGYDPKHTVIVGDSAGGNLTLSLLLKLRNEGSPLPKAAVLMSPWADLSGSTESYRKNYKLDVLFGHDEGELTNEKIENLLKCDIYAYCGDADRKDPYLSPLFGDYHGMCPMHFSVGTNELLLDEVCRVAEKVQEAGVEAVLHKGEGMFHVYPLFYKFLPEAKTTFDEILDFIEEKLK